MTRLICARCRYECQTELQRVICPRCASIIDTPAEPPGAAEPLELEQNQGFEYVEEEDVELSSALGLATSGAISELDVARSGVRSAGCSARSSQFIRGGSLL